MHGLRFGEFELLPDGFVLERGTPVARVWRFEETSYFVMGISVETKRRFFASPLDAFLAFARHLHGLKVESVSGRAIVLGDAHVTGDEEVCGVPKIPEFDVGKFFVKTILERLASIAPSNEFEVELSVPKPGFRADFPASVRLEVRSASDWTVRTNLGRPPDSVELISKYVDLCERTYRLAEDVRRAVEASVKDETRG